MDKTIVAKLVLQRADGAELTPEDKLAIQRILPRGTFDGTQGNGQAAHSVSAKIPTKMAREFTEIADAFLRMQRVAAERRALRKT